MNVTLKLKNRVMPRTWIDVNKVEENDSSVILWFKSEQHTPVSIQKSEVEHIELSLGEFEGIRLESL
ncbi:hypothetical protein ACT91Q_01460 [Brevibacillus thermoruber]|uniref:hypothetical protein n=1 Tax=Brevibacillus thermoruber TaxID=33942 RepID=UPI0040436D80